ncbi:Surfactin synthase subunit 3 [Patescibacteria group bacterium]|nr:Surfactin synthase subunit 3 [Patescibacteria group bacterium]
MTITINKYKMNISKIKAVMMDLEGVTHSEAFYYQETNAMILFVELSPTSRLLKEDIRLYLADYLSVDMLPKKIISLIKFPIDEHNKINKEKLYELIKDYEFSHVEPITAFEIEVAGIWSNVLNRENIGIHDNFFELGGNVTKALAATAMIEQSFNVEIPYGYFYHAQTVYEFAKAIANHNFCKPKWLSQINKGTGVPIYWMLDGVSILRKHLPDNQEIYVVNTHYDFIKTTHDYVALNKHSTVELMCEEIAKEILEINQGNHCIIGGFSMGSTFACEIAVQLKKQGMMVDLLILLDPLEKSDHASVDKVLLWKFKRWLKSLYYFYFCILPPINFRPDYVLQAYRFLRSKYVKPKYDGRVLLMQKIMKMKLEKRDWFKITNKNNLVFFNLDTTEHVDVVKNKNIQIQWINKIRELIY